MIKFISSEKDIKSIRTQTGEMADDNIEKKTLVSLASQKMKGISGLALVHYILMVLIAVIVLMFFIDGYIRHLQDAARTYDSEEVNEAIAIATTQYLFDSAPSKIIYYYDAETKQVYPREYFRRSDRIDIKGYGRTLAYQNKNKETGAVGIPNRGLEKYRDTMGELDGGAVTTRDDVTHNSTFFDNIIMNVTGLGNASGAQFLAISFKDGQLEQARWRGPVLYYYDWTIMTESERSQLNTDELSVIRVDAPEGSTLKPEGTKS